MFKLFSRPPKLDREAFEAYWHKLPENISISWFRNGNFIVGNIDADGEQFMTQGRSADEFVDMVNETVYAVYDVPVEYHSVLRDSNREFVPNTEQYERLKDKSVQHSIFSLKKSAKRQLA